MKFLYLTQINKGSDDARDILINPRLIEYAASREVEGSTLIKSVVQLEDGSPIFVSQTMQEIQSRLGEI